MYWLGADCPMPWIIGETGFVAEDDELDPLDVSEGYNYRHLDDDPAHHQMPYMNGNELEQAAFAQLGLDAVRDYRGSGFSWWDFQNSRGTWLLETDPDKLLQGNFYALLKYGNDVILNEPLYPEWLHLNPWRDKIAVNTFATYDPGPAPDELPTPPAEYFSWVNSGGDFYREYTIKDQYDEPVANALAVVEWFYYTSNPLDGDAGIGVWDRNPATQEGICTIRARPGLNPAYGVAPVSQKLRFDISGASSLAYNGVWLPNGSVIPITRSRLYMERTLTDHTVPVGVEEVHVARSSLTVAEVVVEGAENTGGIADFKARDEVHAVDGFHAQRGSEVHLHTEAVFLDCSTEVVGMVQEPDLAHTAVVPKARSTQKQLRLNFNQPKLQVSVYPNPASTTLYIVLPESAGQCTISSISGSIVYTGLLRTGMSEIDVSHWPVGDYTVYITAREGIHTSIITKL